MRGRVKASVELRKLKAKLLFKSKYGSFVIGLLLTTPLRRSTRSDSNLNRCLRIGSGSVACAIMLMFIALLIGTHSIGTASSAWDTASQSFRMLHLEHSLERLSRTSIEQSGNDNCNRSRESVLCCLALSENCCLTTVGRLKACQHPRRI
jgi:hypothetical protein